MIEVTSDQGITYAHCPCHAEGIIIDAEDVPLSAERVRDHLLDLIEHAKTCPSASSVQAAQVARLLAERHPRLPLERLS